MEAIYERYVRQLKQEHWGKFVAVSLDGRVLLLAKKNLPSFNEALRDFGSGNFVMMRVGLKVVGKI
jgi:DnaJ-domain-containing protein 1